MFDSDDESHFALIGNSPPPRSHVFGEHQPSWKAPSLRTDSWGRSAKPVSGNLKELMDLQTKKFLDAENDREYQLWATNVELRDQIMKVEEKEKLNQNLNEKMEGMKEDILNLKKQLMAAEDDREIQVWGNDEELKALKMELEEKERVNKDLEAEIENLRKAAADKKEKDNEFDEDYEKFKKTKKKNRAAFCKYYNDAKRVYVTHASTQFDIFILMFLSVLIALLSFYVKPELQAIGHVLSVLSVLLVGNLDTHDRKPRQAAYIAIIASTVASFFACGVASPVLFALLSVRILLGFFYIWSLRRESLDKSIQLCILLEKASGLDFDGTAADDNKLDDDPVTSESADSEAAAAAAETREVHLTKKGVQELGLIVSTTTQSKLFVSYVIPRSISERSNFATIGDEIVSINGVNLKGASIEFAQFLVNGIDGALSMEVRTNTDLVAKKHHYL